MNQVQAFYLQNKKVFEYALYKKRTIGYSKKTITKKNGSTRELNIPPWNDPKKLDKK